MAKRLAGSTRLSIAIPANLGYRFYAYHLDTFYTCDWFMDRVRLKADRVRPQAEEVRLKADTTSGDARTA